MQANDIPTESSENPVKNAEERPVESFRAFLKRHSLVIGILLMFLLTWPVMLANSGFLPFKVPFVAGLFAGWGVSIAALIMTGATLGKAGVITLLRRFLIWRVSWKWYAVALLLYPLMQSVAVVVTSLVSGIRVDFGTVAAHRIFGQAAYLPIFVLPFLLTDLITNGEELGWRGYVLPRLQARHSALVASLILGLIWAFWHLPILAAPGNSGQYGFFLVKVIADAVLYTWLYNNSKGSLLLVTLFHTAGNTGGAFLPVATTITVTSASTMLIQIGIEVLVVAIVILTQGPARLSRTQPKQVQE